MSVQSQAFWKAWNYNTVSRATKFNKTLILSSDSLVAQADLECFLLQMQKKVFVYSASKIY